LAIIKFDFYQIEKIKNKNVGNPTPGGFSTFCFFIFDLYMNSTYAGSERFLLKVISAD